MKVAGEQHIKQVEHVGVPLSNSGVLRSELHTVSVVEMVDIRRPIDLTHSGTRASDAVFSTRVRCNHNRRKGRSRVRPTHGIHARSHSLRLAGRNVLLGAPGLGGVLRRCRPRERTCETAAVAVVILRWHRAFQSRRNQKLNNCVAPYGYGMRSETPYAGTG